MRLTFRQELIFAILYVGIFTSLTIDIASHHHGAVFSEEGFFTITHSVGYGFFAVLLIYSLYLLYKNYRSDDVDSIFPRWYSMFYVGLFLFVIGVPLDYFWHHAFGNENGIEALVSPSHLLLFIGGFLYMSAPFRSALESDRKSTQRAILATFTCALAFDFIMQPFVLGDVVTNTGRWPAYEAGAADFVSIPLFAITLVSPIIVLSRIKYFTMKYTFFFFTVGVPSVFIMIQEPDSIGSSFFALIIPFIMVGLLSDGIFTSCYGLLDSQSSVKLDRFRVIGFTVPVVFHLCWLSVFYFAGSFVWSIHIWSGLVVLSGVTGLLLVFVVSTDIQLN